MPDSFYDFSANINPLGPPAGLKEQWPSFFESILEYPDPETRELTELAASMEHVSEKSILFGNGGAELISLTARMLAGKNVLIIQPAFSEYAAACLANQCTITNYILKEPEWKLDVEGLKPLIKNQDALYLCTPNNPTGMSYAKEDVLELLTACQKENCLVILDEAFYDFVLDPFTYRTYLSRFANLIILRSMTKMFAMPGVRLGYLLAHPGIIDALQSFKPHWSVSSLAQKAGSICLREIVHQKETVEYIEKQKRQLQSFYKTTGLVISQSSVNFYLLRDPELDDTKYLLTYLLGKGIVPRHTYNFPGLDGKWLRFAVKGERDHAVLMEEFTQWKKHRSTL